VGPQADQAVAGVDPEHRPGAAPRGGQVVDRETADDDVASGAQDVRDGRRPSSTATASRDSAAKTVTAAVRCAGWPA
jgi:hypothetical protein